MEGFAVLSDKHFMKEALKEANRAFDKDEIPVGVSSFLNNGLLLEPIT